MAWNSGTSGARNLHSLTSTSARSVSAASSSSGHLKGARQPDGLRVTHVRGHTFLTQFRLPRRRCAVCHTANTC